mmetsp:Transcript_1296/g.3987  ORF Transcript_1296/g.3987 Transcript_1296/m.3987 type:complete len:553 (-) Transcript_1296:13-1671(-)
MCCTRIDASSPSGASPCHSSSPWYSSSSSICLPAPKSLCSDCRLRDHSLPCALDVAVYLALATLLLVLGMSTAVFAHKGGLFIGISHPWLESAAEHTSTTLARSGITLQSTFMQRTLEVDESVQETCRVLAFVSGVLMLVVILFISLSFKQIKRTTAMVSEATSVLRNSPGMVLVPLASYLAQLAVLAGCGTVLAYIWTDPTRSYEATLSWAEEAARRLNGTAGIHFQVDSILSRLPVYESGYVAFCGLWTYFFCETISTTVISGCAVYYYLIDSDTAGHHDERYEDNQTNLVTLTQLRQVCSCNLGTMAFGSLILALVGALRSMLELVDRVAQKDCDEVNCVLSYTLKCCKCCLLCFEKSIKFLTSYAYAFVVLENRGFCSACFMSYNLLSEYAAQVAINQVVCNGLYWIQITVTPVVCFVCSYNIMMYTNNDGEIDASSNYGPLVVSGAIATIAFLLARAFAAVYEQTVTALTVCVLHDIDEYDPPFISRRLYEAFELEPDWDEFRAKGLGRQRRQYRGEGLGKADVENENRGLGDQDRTPDRWWAGVAR